ncbi:MAG TPA: hypothetical protein VFO31_11555 [Vicinamibacterales bacterium]|nr:hypothetical protein [Vicinamibacterales bacterium]
MVGRSDRFIHSGRHSSPSCSEAREGEGEAQALNIRDNAFLNIPYDRRYENLYLAFIAGLSAFGLSPRATVELSGSQRRLDRIIHLLRSCRFSFHDLSRVTLDRTPPATPRFNMPFELGLAIAFSEDSKHEWFVFEARPHRLTKSLSDLNGTDPHIHSGSPSGVLCAMANALVRRRDRPSAQQLNEVYEDVCRAAREIRRSLHASNLFDARAFDELVIAGRISAHRRMSVSN